MLRTITLSFLMLVTVVVMLPFASSTAPVSGQIFERLKRFGWVIRRVTRPESGPQSTHRSRRFQRIQLARLRSGQTQQTVNLSP